MAEIISYKRLAKLPRVVLEQGMRVKIRDWFVENHLSVMVPPIFNRFVIEYPSGAKCSVPQSLIPQFLGSGGFRRPKNPEELNKFPPQSLPREYEKLEPHEWVVWDTKTELLVEYAPSLTKATITVYEDGKRSYALELDYEDLDMASGVWRTAMDLEIMPDEDAQSVFESNHRHANETIENVIAVQSYVLYHRSEQIAAPKVIKVGTTPAATTGKKPKKRKTGKGAVTIKHQRRQTIIIRESDPLPRKEYNYRTLAWNVRGHYARRGADKHLTYIAPYICRRGDEKKKPRAIEYRITEGDKK